MFYIYMYYKTYNTIIFTVSSHMYYKEIKRKYSLLFTHAFTISGVLHLYLKISADMLTKSLIFHLPEKALI